jgi:hypothetical protein
MKEKMIRKTFSLLAVCGIAMFAIIGCGGSSNSVPTTTTLAPLTSEETATVALPYFENFAMSTAGGFDRMKAMSVKNSPAEKYFQHQRYLSWAGGGYEEASEVRKDGAVIKICNRQTMFDDSCASYSKYSNFVLGSDRTKVDTFDIQDEPLEDRLGVSSQEFDCRTYNDSYCGPTGNGLGLTVMSVYLSANDYLTITYKFERGSKWKDNMRVKAIRITKPNGSKISSDDFSKGMPNKGKTKFGYASFEGLRGVFSPTVALEGEVIVQWQAYSNSFSYKFTIYG